jgi:hypothetical protein
MKFQDAKFFAAASMGQIVQGSNPKFAKNGDIHVAVV